MRGLPRLDCRRNGLRCGPSGRARVAAHPAGDNTATCAEHAWFFRGALSSGGYSECHHEPLRLPTQTRPIRHRRVCREGGLGQQAAEGVPPVRRLSTTADSARFATATTGTFHQVAAGDRAQQMARDGGDCTPGTEDPPSATIEPPVSTTDRVGGPGNATWTRTMPTSSAC